MKKLTRNILMVAATMSLVACGATNAQPEPEAPEVGEVGIDSGPAEISVEQRRIGMLPDSGGVNDQSFNQGTWEGVLRFFEDHPEAIEEPTHIVPAQTATADMVAAGEQLILAGKELIVMSGFTFQGAVEEMQVNHPDVKFVIIDAAPEEILDNTLAIFFAEQESGFLAGVTAALETETGQVGFIGGANIPPVQAFGRGFAMGIAYANANLDTDAVLSHYVYQGGFADAQAGGTLAAGIYDAGVDIIFAAAGNVGNGVIAEARTRADGGSRVYVIGVDSDQFEAGVMPNGESVILTSAMKRVDQAAYDAIESFVNGTFEGGRSMTLTAADGGVGLPDENPNLSAETLGQVDTVMERLQNGELQVPMPLDEVLAFLEEQGYDTASLPAAFSE